MIFPLENNCRFVGFFSSFVIASLFGSVVLAQSSEEVAKQNYQEAIRLFDNGDYSDAAARFRDAYEANPSWKLFFNIGQAEAAASRLGMALEAFEAYMVQGGDQVPEDKKEVALNEIQRLRQLVGVLELVAPDDSELWIDEGFRGRTPFDGPVRVEVGERRIAVKKNGVLLREVQLRMSSGAVVRLEVQEANDNAIAGPVVSGGTPDDDTSVVDMPPSSSSHQPLLISGAVAGGVGVAGLVAGVVLAAKSGGFHDDYLKAGEAYNMERTAARYDEVRDLEGKWLSTRTGAVVALSVGTALTVTGVVLVAVAMKQRNAQRVRPATARVSFLSNGVRVSF
ncbi:MAG: tetratricopeptide repeat protein [Proteobacteria bacterium]|nr:tetratricopeptide repeat protein [Pseudomonadota bacterium]